MTTLRSIVRYLWLPVIALGLCLAAAPVEGQGLDPRAGQGRGEEETDPMAARAAPQPTYNDEYSPWIGYVFMFVFVILVMSISIMPSKRSHQD